jgi:hypothetical protein
VKPKTARMRNTIALLAELDDAMLEKKYGQVDELLTSNPTLIHGLTAKCEVPLVMAIKYWDIHLVEICMRHGADPYEKHLCSKDNLKPKIPIVIAVEELKQRTNCFKTAYEKHNKIYVAILQTMVCTAPFKTSGK